MKKQLIKNTEKLNIELKKALLSDNYKKANDILNLIADLKKMFKKAEKFQP